VYFQLLFADNLPNEVEVL